jgi:hypothetical protein
MPICTSGSSAAESRSRPNATRSGSASETCKIKNAYPGQYYIGVYGVTDYSRLSIKVTY